MVRRQQSWVPKTFVSRTRAWNENGWGSTHIHDKALAPSLLVPWELVLLFKFDKKFALKVKELVESREEVVNCILIDHILLHERTGVILLTRKGRN